MNTAIIYPYCIYSHQWKNSGHLACHWPMCQWCIMSEFPSFFAHGALWGKVSEAATVIHYVDDLTSKQDWGWGLWGLNLTFYLLENLPMYTLVWLLTFHPWVLFCPCTGHVHPWVYDVR
jgi:hypothetical protein